MCLSCFSSLKPEGRHTVLVLLVVDFHLVILILGPSLWNVGLLSVKVACTEESISDVCSSVLKGWLGPDSTSTLTEFTAIRLFLTVLSKDSSSDDDDTANCMLSVWFLGRGIGWRRPGTGSPVSDPDVSAPLSNGRILSAESVSSSSSSGDEGPSQESNKGVVYRYSAGLSSG